MIPTLRPVAALALGLALALPTVAGAQAPARTITVSGEGSTSVAPDMASISIGVHEEAASAREAMDRMSAALGPVLDELAASGIAPGDIRTSALTLAGRYIYPENAEPELTGYSASSSIEIRLRDLDRVGTVLDAVVSEGANRLSGISFGLSDPGAAQDEARRAAVADARARAELYAEAAGVALGEVLTITESGGHTPMPMAYAMRESAPAPVAPGKIEISASVTIIYAIE